jgi:hypothetical protein
MAAQATTPVMKTCQTNTSAVFFSGTRYAFPLQADFYKNPLAGFHRNRTGLKGFEPLTYGLRVRRSTELSYKPAN